MVKKKVKSKCVEKQIGCIYTNMTRECLNGRHSKDLTLKIQAQAIGVKGGENENKGI
jgi:hypothetical protein